MEIWPPGLLSYHLLVPNFLNLPFLLFGAGPPKATVGLVMYEASKAAGCAYCTAHCCTFALRRGAQEHQITEPAKDSASTVARAIALVPSTLTSEQVQALRAQYSASDAEWIVLAAAMMGFLNKFMDAMGISLEESMLAVAQHVIGPGGWSPGRHGVVAELDKTSVPEPERFTDLLGIVPRMPALIYHDARWSRRVPAKAAAARTYLSRRTGHDFPVLSRLTHARAIRALTTIIAANTDASTSELGLPAKYRAGLEYASAVQDEGLAGELEALIGHAGGDEENAQALALARAASSSPALIGPDEIAASTAELSPAAIIELMVWLSVLQTLHRLRVYYN
jgi:alkylhydroperoxidase family enzyme